MTTLNLNRQEPKKKFLCSTVAIKKLDCKIFHRLLNNFMDVRDDYSSFCFIVDVCISVVIL